MKKNIVQAAIVLILSLALTGCVWKDFNVYEPIKKTFVMELGDKLSKKPEDYIQAGNKKALEKTKLNMKDVDNMKTGTYKAEATYKDKKAAFEIEVKDTTAPEITLTDKAEGYKAIVGKKVPARELIETVEDLSNEIKTITVDEEYCRKKDTDSKEKLDQFEILCPKVGEQEVTVTATDYSGNTATKKFTMKVIEDYIQHVGGFMNLNVNQGEGKDWMEGITWDEKIKSVTPDDSGIDLNTPGEYTLKYNILGDDNETKVVKEVKVTVLAPLITYDSTGNGSAGSGYSGAGGGTRRSGGSSGSGGSYGGSGGGSGSGSSNGGSSGSGNGMQPGQSWEGTKTDEGPIDYNGNTGESGTWDPWG